MGKLPVYDSKVSMTTQLQQQPKDMAVASQGGRNLQKLGETVSTIQNAWQEAVDFNDKLTKKNEMDDAIRQVSNEAEKDNDPKNAPKYNAKLDEIRKQSTEGFSNNLARQEFSATVNDTINRAQIGIDNLFMGKLIDHTKANIKISHKTNKEKYIATGDKKYIQAQKDIVTLADAEGFLKATEIADEEIKMADWDYDRALYDAQKDPFGTLTRLDQYTVETGKKDDLVREIKQIAEIKVKQEEVQVLEMQYGNQQKFLEAFDQGMPLSQALDLLEKSAEAKTMDPDWAKTRRQAILSAKGIDAETQLDYQYQIVQKINRASAKYAATKGGFGKTKNAKEYIKEANEALIMMNKGRDEGLLSMADEKLLLARIYTKEVAGAEQDAGKKLIAATDYFSSVLTPDQIPEAVNDYLATTGKPGKEPETPDIAEAIANKVKERTRQKSIQTVDDLKLKEAPQEKVIGGVTYKKVEGGWLPK